MTAPRNNIRMLFVWCLLLVQACSSTHEGRPWLSFFAPRSETEATLGHGLLRARLITLCEQVEKDKTKERDAKIGQKYHAASPAIQAQIDALLTSHPPTPAHASPGE